MSAIACHAVVCPVRHRVRRRRIVACDSFGQPAACGQRAGFTYTNGLIHSQTLNARGLPQRIRDRSGAASRLDYTYDAHGHRTLSTRNTGSIRHQIYTRAGQLLYTEDSKDNQRIDYIHLGNKLIAQRSRPLNTSTATLTWHHTDAIQSANVETSSAGAQTYRTVRMPFGAPYSGQYREGPGFAGHETNLTYMQQRYYDPIAQRFLSPDPVDVSGTNGANFNRYWYANNNPYKFVDPDGRSGVAFLGGVITESWNALNGRGFDGAMVMGALKDGYNGEGDGVVGAIIEDASAVAAVAGGIGALRSAGVLAAKGGKAIVSRLTRGAVKDDVKGGVRQVVKTGSEK